MKERRRLSLISLSAIIAITAIIAIAPSVSWGDEGDPVNIADTEITLEKTVFKVTGAKIEPKVTVKYSGAMLARGTDYQLLYSNNIAIGTGKIKITGLGNYTGSTTKTFTIEAVHERGWNTISGKRYYYNNDDTYVTGWKNITNSNGKKNRYHFGSDGVMDTYWQNITNSNGKRNRYYFGSDGVMDIGWRNITNGNGDTYRYHFDSYGRMDTGWNNITNDEGKTYRYHFDAYGRMDTGWKNIKNSKGKTNRYHFDAYGRMDTGWKNIKSSKGKTYRYHFGSDGIMDKGWQKLRHKDGKLYWYFFGKGANDGKLRTGWQKIRQKDGKLYWYFFGKDANDGRMRTGWQKIRQKDGKLYSYYFGKTADDGRMRYGWQNIKLGDGKTYRYYFGSANDGRMRVGRCLINGVQVVFNSKGWLNGKSIFVVPTPKPGERWAEVDLSKQRAYFYSGKKLLRTCVISSGRAGYSTRVGHFRVWTKVRIQDMRGGSVANGTFYLTRNVPFVTYFDRDIAFHYAYWHNNFGHPMSHGCINMKLDDAKFQYNYLKIGDRVVVHH